LDSVRLIGVVHPPGMNVSALEAVLGGAGGSLGLTGGATNPGSSVPSPARIVPAQSVAARMGSTDLVFICFSLVNVFISIMCDLAKWLHFYRLFSWVSRV